MGEKGQEKKLEKLSKKNCMRNIIINTQLTEYCQENNKAYNSSSLNYDSREELIFVREIIFYHNIYIYFALNIKMSTEGGNKERDFLLGFKYLNFILKKRAN